MPKLLKKLDAALYQILRWACIVLIAVMLVLIIIQVLFRYFLKIPSPWSEEIARLALVWSVFLASAIGIRNLEHPKIDILTRRFPPAIRKALEIGVYLLIIAFSCVIVYYGAKYVMTTSMDHNTSLRYPKNLFYLPGPVGGALFILYSIGHIVGIARGREDGTGGGQEIKTLEEAEEVAGE